MPPTAGTQAMTSGGARSLGSDVAECRRASRGFSLVELLVVLAIIALVLVAIPNILAGLPGLRFRRAAEDVAATLRGLHEQAIRHQATTEFLLDPVAHSYRTSIDPSVHVLTDAVTEVGFTTFATTPGEPMARIRFFADGSATGGTIRLARGSVSTSIVVDWLTGRVSRHD